MLLSITTTYFPATDLGFLLHKHPDRFQTVNLTMGQAHVFYPQKSEAKTTACLLLDIDPIDLMRGARNMGGARFALGQYVNDRPYVASSFISSAMAKTFSSALNGKCKDKPELVDTKLPFEVEIAALPAPKGGETLIRRFFEPMGYDMDIRAIPLDDKFPEWGDSKYFNITLRNTLTTQCIDTGIVSNLFRPSLD